MSIRTTRVVWNRMGADLGAIASRFNFRQALGGGCMYEVHRHTEADGSAIAVKIPRVNLPDSPAYRPGEELEETLPSFLTALRFLEHEASAHRRLGSIPHENLLGYRDHGAIECEVSDLDQEMALVYLAMEYIEGFDLSRVIYLTRGFSRKAVTALRPEKAVSFTQAAAKGLERIHGRGWVLGVLTPSNLIGDKKSGRVALFDFNSARPAGEYIPLEKTGYIGGFTPHYASERRMAGEPPTTKDDVFALGISLYEMLRGGLPFYDTQVRFFDRAALGRWIARLSEQGQPRLVIELIHKMTGTTGEYGVYEQGGYEHAEQVVDHINTTLDSFIE